jgi:hypothetical protein
MLVAMRNVGFKFTALLLTPVPPIGGWLQGGSGGPAVSDANHQQRLSLEAEAEP